MKKIIVFIALSIAVAACSKKAPRIADNSTGNNNTDTTNHNPDDTLAANTMTANINDTPRIYTIGVTTTTINITGGQDIAFTAFDTSENELEFSVEEANTISTGAFTDIGNATSDAGFDYLVGNSFVEYDNADQKSHPFNIAFTSVSSTNIKGTFDGIIYQNYDTLKPSLTITNGRFNVNR
jgi:hypothetical protein